MSLLTRTFIRPHSPILLETPFAVQSAHELQLVDERKPLFPANALSCR